MNPVALPQEFLEACRRQRARLTRDVLLVSVAQQTVTWCRRAWGGKYQREREFIASTSRFGTGQVANSNRTPLGLHRIARKIGAGWPAGTVFESRRAVGFTWAGRPDAAIAHRILGLEGLEPGLNRGGEVDTFRRYIYIHGVGDEPTLGRPASRGCVHLAAADLLPLYDRVGEGTLVWIA